MAYATIADMEKRLAQPLLQQLAGQPAGSTGYNDAINEKLDAAAAVIDSYAGQRYDLPLQTSEMVQQLSVDIAAYLLERDRGTIRDSERDSYNDALRFLRDLAAGKATLDQPTGATAQTGSGEPKATDKTRVFSDTNLSGF